MSKERELLKGWLCIDPFWIDPAYMKMYEDTKKLLAEPEQEPVAWMSINNNGGISIDSYYANHKDYVPLYLAPPTRDPLSEDKLDVLAEANITDEGIAGYYLGFRDAEKYHNIGGGE